MKVKIRGDVIDYDSYQIDEENMDLVLYDEEEEEVARYDLNSIIEDFLGDEVKESKPKKQKRRNGKHG